MLPAERNNLYVHMMLIHSRVHPLPHKRFFFFSYLPLFLTLCQSPYLSHSLSSTLSHSPYPSCFLLLPLCLSPSLFISLSLFLSHSLYSSLFLSLSFSQSSTQLSLFLFLFVSFVILSLINIIFSFFILSSLNFSYLISSHLSL